MTKNKRRQFSAEFKAKVALEALRGELTISELAKKHGVHPNMIAGWKRQAMEGMAGLFEKRAPGAGQSQQSEVEKLRRQIGQQHKGWTPRDLADKIAQRNIDKYGAPLGPAITWLRSHNKSWRNIIDAASRTGGRDLGL